ncbi:MAG TPA: condensation domain-containing protein, partial [Candidatus Deferrimicrobium sp.]|nr:condensation domain-containing protein [Candidatus Deferrimicrobium sp.]
AELFKTPTIRGVSEYLRRTAKHSYESIMPVEEKEYYVLSFAQQRMYILQQMDLNSTAYNMPQAIPLSDGVDIEKLLETFKKLLKRHDSLRTSFHMIGDQPVQKIHRDIDFKIEKIEWSHFVRPFDLTRAPLLRVGLTEGNRYLLVDMHHIISDGISHEVLRDDFKAFYEGKELPSLRIQYKDFVQWQNSPEELGRIHRQMLYWLNEFAGEIPVLELPLDYPRPLVQSFDGAGIEFEFSLEQTGSLNEIALQAGATLFMVLTAVIDVLLAKISGQEEIIIGTPTAGRRHSDLEKIIGMFVNTLAIKNYPIGERTFGDFLADVKERMLMVFDNREYPFEALVDKLVLNRDTGRNPLFDVMFSWQNMSDDYQSPKPGSQYEYHVAKFDLTFTAVEIDQKLFFSIQYCTQLFKPETIDRFILYFRKVIDSVIENKDQRISGIEIISKEEKSQILENFNNTGTIYPQDKTIHRLFVEQVEKTPDHIALVGAGSQTCPIAISYNELNAQSDRWAGLLIKKGVRGDDIVGIMMERSIEMIIGIFGILKSGGAYMPIDPEYPQERIDYMLKDSGAKWLV